MVPQRPLLEIACPSRCCSSALRIDGGQRIVERHVKKHRAQEPPRDVNQSTCKHRRRARLGSAKQADDDEDSACHSRSEEDRHEQGVQNRRIDRVHGRDALRLFDAVERRNDGRRKCEIEPSEQPAANGTEPKQLSDGEIGHIRLPNASCRSALRVLRKLSRCTTEGGLHAVR